MIGVIVRGAADPERLGAYLSRAKETRTIAILLLFLIFFGSPKMSFDKR